MSRATQIMMAYPRPPLPVPPKLYALGNMNAADYFATAAGAGELGVATGFGFALGLAPLPRGGATYAIVFGKGPNFYELWLNNPNQLQLNMANGSGATVTLYHTFSASDMARFHSIIMTHEGSSIALYVDGKKSTSAAITGHKSSTFGTYLGRRSDGAYPLNDAALVTPPIAWQGVLSEAAIKDLSDYFRTAYDWPTSLAGGTLTHRSSLLETLAKTTVVDGQVAPASLADTVTVAAPDAFVRTGSPKVRVPLSLDGNTRYGILPYDSYYQADALIPPTTRMVMHVRFIINTSTANATRGVMSNDSAGGGFWIAYTSDGVAAPVFMTGWRGVSYYNPTINGHVSDLGVPVQIAIVYVGGGTSTVYIKRRGQPVAVLGSSAGATITAGAQKLCLGYGPYSGYQGIGTSIIDATWVTDTTDISLSEVTDAMDRTELTNEITGFEARPYHRYIPHLDVVANGGPDVPLPATILDRPHTLAPVNLTRVGTPAAGVSRRVERDFNYEVAPIARGAAGLSASNHFVTQAPLSVGVAPWWATVACVISATTTLRVLLSCLPSGTGAGFQLISAASSTVGTFSVVTAAGTAYLTTTTLPPLKRFVLLSGLWNVTAAKIQLAVNGLTPAGYSGSNPAAFAPPSPLYIGSSAKGEAAADCAIFGAAVGTGIVTASQFRAQYDAWVALDGATVPGIPGQTSHQWRLVDANGSIPATVLDQVGGNHLTRVGAPTVEPYYVRTFAA